MNFEDTLKVKGTPQIGYDEDGNPVEEPSSEWQAFGKWIINLADGQQFVYSHEIYAPLSKAKYPLIPKEGDKVWITKKDGTIDKEMEVKGFVTYKRRYLRIWL